MMRRWTFALAAGLTAAVVRTAPAFDINNLDVTKVVSGSAKLVKAAKGFSDNEEIKLGREVAARLAGQYGLVQDEKQVRYVNLVGQAVVRHSERKKIPYHFAILRVSEINAMAAPGGYVFITQGLLDSLKDESELAGVLAHEISHVTRQHIVKAIRQAKLLEAGEDFAAAAGNEVNRYGKLGDFTVNLLSNGLSRADELEADQQGTLLASRVGYDAAGLRHSIEFLKTQEKSALLLSHFNKTHPPADDRIKAIDQTLKSNKVPAGGRQNTERFLQHR